MRRKFKIVIVSSDDLVPKDIHNRLRSCFVNTEIELHIVKETQSVTPVKFDTLLATATNEASFDLVERSPTELVIQQLQHWGLIIERNISLLQTVGDRQVLTKDKLKILLLTGQELADKVDQFSIYVTHQLAQLKSKPVE